MTREEKIAVVEGLGQTLTETPNIYIVDGGGLNVAQVSNLRRLCHEAGIKMQVVKNTLLKKALENAEGNYDGLYDTLKQQSAVFFVGEDGPNAPAKVIKDFQKANPDMPRLKSAYVGEAIFIGEDQLDILAKMKSKNELIGEIITLLQSPAKTVIGSLQSGGQKLAGIIKTLQEREA
jgi:large subunit ribosomal protein L10